MRSAAVMRTVHEQEEVGSGCGCCCCGRLLGKELGQLGEVLKEALTASQGASASTKPLPRRVPGNPAPALRKSSSFGEQCQSGLWAMGNAAVVAWAGVLQVWGRRSGAGGALAAVPSDGPHRAVFSSEGGFIVPLHRSIIMSLLSICGAKSWPSGAWSDQTSNTIPSHTRWENF